MLHRHADAQQVRYLLQNREAVWDSLFFLFCKGFFISLSFPSTVQACYAEVGVPDRDEVKKFFNGILMGGGSEHCERFMLRYKLSPPLCSS